MTSTKREPLKVGDKVRLKCFACRVADGWAVRVDGLRAELVNKYDDSEWVVAIRGLEGKFRVFESQCRRLHPKRRREIWIRRDILPRISLIVDNKLAVTTVDRADSPEWVHFVESRKKVGG